MSDDGHPLLRGLAKPPLLAFRAMGRLISRPYRFKPIATERLEARTSDGVTLEVRRLRRSERPARGLVLLQHGLGSNSSTFLIPGRSLAEALAARGFDCFIPDLRGQRGSRSGQKPNKFDWSVDDYVDRDLPAIVAAVLKHGGRSRLHWVGHSMGGVLLYMYGIRHGTESLACAVAVASGLDYSIGPTIFREQLPLRPLLGALPWIPYGSLTKFVSPIVGRIPLKITTMNTNPKNIEAEVVRRAYANIYEDIAPGVLRRLATTFDAEGFRHGDGFRYTEHAARFRAPLLALAGSVDKQISPAAVRATVALIGSAEKRLRIFGGELGDKNQYGHFDLIAGRDAPTETWPVMGDWLDAHGPE